MVQVVEASLHRAKLGLVPDKMLGLKPANLLSGVLQDLVEDQVAAAMGP